MMVICEHYDCNMRISEHDNSNIKRNEAGWGKWGRSKEAFAPHQIHITEKKFFLQITRKKTKNKMENKEQKSANREY